MSGGIADEPAILKALSPTYAVGFLVGDFSTAFFSLAAVVLAITGAEALYADMGHFGRALVGVLVLVFGVPPLGRAGVRVRHGGDRDDRDHHRAVLLPRPLSVAAAVVGGGRRRHCVRRGGPAVLRTAVYGYLEDPDIPALLAQVPAPGETTPIETGDASYFLSTIEPVVGDEPGMARWRKRLFVATAATADAATYFALPRDRTVVMGTRIEV